MGQQLINIIEKMRPTTLLAVVLTKRVFFISSVVAVGLQAGEIRDTIGCVE